MNHLTITLLCLASFLISVAAQENLRGLNEEISSKFFDPEAMVKPFVDQLIAHHTEASKLIVNKIRPAEEFSIKNGFSHYGNGYSVQRMTDNDKCKINKKAWIAAAYNLNDCHKVPGVGSSLLYRLEDENDDSWQIWGNYFSDENCNANNYVSNSPIKVGEGCKDGLRETWTEKFTPPKGIVANIGYGTTCPTAMKGSDIFKYITIAPMNTCMSSGENESYTILDCKESKGFITATLKTYDKSSSCTGKSKTRRNYKVTKACTKSGGSDTIFARYTCNK